MDTGLNYNHEDLAANLWDGGASYPKHGYNFVDGNTDPMDLNGHGTHVAGIIGAQGNNSIGTTGVCWRSTIMAVRVLDATGSGKTTNIISGIQFAVSHGAKVINLSLGGPTQDSALQSAIQDASDAGVVVVMAAGNDGTNNDDAATPSYPCNYAVANRLCVAALDQAFALADSSNFGANSVDVGAPGTNIVSTMAASETVITDSFHSSGSTALNWTSNGNTWGTSQHSFLSGGQSVTIDILSNPSNWNGASQNYANNLDARVYKTFNLSGADRVALNFGLLLDIDSSDLLTVSAKSGTGDPFSSGGTPLASGNGSTAGSSEAVNLDLTQFVGGSCTLGFQLTSDSSKTGTGAAILAFSISKFSASNSSYATLDGTSMATPEVSGIAALLFAYNPAFTAGDVVAAIKYGGTPTPALKGKTTSGNAANAMGALKYLSPVSGLTATNQ